MLQTNFCWFLSHFLLFTYQVYLKRSFLTLVEEVVEEAAIIADRFCASLAVEDLCKLNHFITKINPYNTNNQLGVRI